MSPLKAERLEAVWTALRAIARGAQSLAEELQQIDPSEGQKSAVQQAQADCARLTMATLDLARQVGKLQELVELPE